MQDKVTLINYANGGSGNFFARLCLMILGDYRAEKFNRLHFNHMHWEEDEWVVDSVTLQDDFNRLIELDKIPNIYKYTQEFGCHENFENVTLPYSEESKQLFKQLILSHTKKYFDHYLCLCHIKNPNPILNAFDDPRYIYIVANEDSFPQLSYNFVTKLIMHVPWRAQIIDEWYNYCKNELKNITVETVSYTDERFVTWLHWMFNNTYQKAQYATTVPFNIPMLKINFEDIVNKKLIMQLDELANLLEINLTNATKEKCINFINVYADNQVTIPWQLSEFDYV